MKVIIYDVPIVLAGRAADWIIANPTRKDAIIVYGDEEHPKATVYVKRNKTSITVRLVPAHGEQK